MQAHLLIIAVIAALAMPAMPAVPAMPAQQHEPVAHQQELVVLVHGMGRSPLSMTPLAHALEKQGYSVMNWGYSSFCCTVSELGHQLRQDLHERRAPATVRVHFVGHSLGNIIIRQVLSAPDAPAGVGSVVMLAPPNQGSHEADRHARTLGWLLRPLVELRTDSASTVRTLPSLTQHPVGVIAGRRDGKVLVGETHLDGEREHVVVPGAHSFLMMRRDVRRLVIGFLRDGRFPALDGVEPAHPAAR